MNDSIAVSLISAASGIVVAYIANVAAKRVQARKEKQDPSDRMEQMFNGYERLIKQKDLEDERKARLIDELEEEIRMTRQMVKNLEHALAISQQELQRSREDNQELKDMLEQMREEYQLQKKVEEYKKVQQNRSKENTWQIK